MISIRKSVDDLERVERLQQVTAAHYAMAVRSAAEYAVELDPSDADEFRRHLNALHISLESASTEADLDAVQSSFRGELRAYRDRADEWLAKVRGELRTAAEAMQTLARDLSTSGSGHEKRMRKDLDALSAAAGSDDLVELRSAVRSGVASIAHDYAQLRNENLLMEAQLREEIRLLHRAIDTERKAGYTDPVTGAWNRKKCEQRLEELLSFGEGFCVVLAWLSNMKRVQISTSQSVLDEALRCLVKRAAAIAGKDATVSRWSEDEFLVILEMDPALGSVLSGELARQLSTRYAVQEQGASQNLVLRVDTVLVDRPAGGEPDRFRKRMEQTSAVLRGI